MAKPTTIDQQKQEWMGRISRMKSRVDAGCIPSPTRRFEVGETIEYGRHAQVKIVTSYDNLFYEVECSGVSASTGGDEHGKLKCLVSWTELFHLNGQKETSFTNKSPLRLNFSNRSIESVLNMAYSFGADINPSYQRPLTWTMSDKESLIESIFNCIDIGKLAFAKNAYEENKKSYDVVDGKQRLSTLLDFYEDRFRYRGEFYSRLSNSDKYTFLEHSIQVCILENCSLKDQMDAFIAINTRGKDVSQEHVLRVIGMREELDDIVCWPSF